MFQLHHQIVSEFSNYPHPLLQVSSFILPLLPMSQVGRLRLRRRRHASTGTRVSPGASALLAAVEAEAASGSAREAAGGSRAEVSADSSSATSACLTQLVVNWWLETWHIWEDH